MKIALIMIKANTYAFINRPSIIRNTPDSLTMGMLYSIIKNAFPDIEVDVYDESVEKIKKEAITADLIGISAMTPTFNKAIEYAQYFKKKGGVVFLGGAHASLMPEECTQYFDSVISGLANESLIELINDFKNGNLKNIYYQNKQLSFENFVHPTRDIYEKKSIWGTELNMVQATYGCSNICEFCVQPHICNGYHQRPIDDVIEEIKQIKSSEIEFFDPNLSKDINYLKKLCEELIPLKKEWFAPLTISVSNNEELLSLLKKSGCTGALIGFESINNDSISTINKGFNQIDKYREAVQKFHEYNIEVTGSFVIGLDGETQESYKQLEEFIENSNIDYPRFTINTPYPGTHYFEKMKAENRISTTDYSKYDCQHCVIKPQNFSAEEIEKIYTQLWKKTYSLKSITKRLSYIKSPSKRFIKCIQNYLSGKVYIKYILKKD